MTTLDVDTAADGLALLLGDDRFARAGRALPPRVQPVPGRAERGREVLRVVWSDVWGGVGGGTSEVVGRSHWHAPSLL